MLKRSVILFLSMISAASATNNQTPQPTNQDQDQSQGQLQAQGQLQGQQQGQVANAEQAQSSINIVDATGGDQQQSNASTNTNTVGGGAGGQGGAGGTANSTSGASADGQQSMTNNTVYARQTPPVILPTILVSDCGSGFNAGGSKAGGAGAFGVTWTSGKCYDFKSGSNWAAIGEYEAACVVWSDVNRKAFKRQKYVPDCKAIAVRLEAESHVKVADPVPAPAPVDLSPYATKEELARAFKQSQAK